MEEEHPNTQTVQYRAIRAVHLKNSIYEEDLEDSRNSFSLEDEHVENIEIAEGTVLIDFDNEEGYSVPIQEVAYLDYDIHSEEVEIQPQREQPRGQRPSPRQEPRGGQPRRR